MTEKEKLAKNHKRCPECEEILNLDQLEHKHIHGAIWTNYENQTIDRYFFDCPECGAEFFADFTYS